MRLIHVFISCDFMDNMQKCTVHTWWHIIKNNNNQTKDMVTSVYTTHFQIDICIAHFALKKCGKIVIRVINNKQLILRSSVYGCKER